MAQPPPNPLPAPPDPLTLPALQGYVRAMVAARNFTRDPNEIFILLVEEVGELATEFKHRTYYPERYDPRNCGHEIADILLYLLDLANAFDLDLMAVWHRHERANDVRFAERRCGAPPQALLRDGMTVNQLTAHVEAKRRERQFEDRDEMLVVLLTEETGEIATELRKGWKGQGDSARLGAELIDAITYVLRLAHRLNVDVEGAIREKEAENAQRVWTY
jgi:NTP pyrophosphatase (non-canonical NTP hydrolase)